MSSWAAPGTTPCSAARATTSSKAAPDRTSSTAGRARTSSSRTERANGRGPTRAGAPSGSAAGMHAAVAGAAVDHRHAVRAGVRDVDGVRHGIDGDAARAEADRGGSGASAAAGTDGSVAGAAVDDADGAVGGVGHIDGVRQLVDCDAARTLSGVHA